MTPLVSIIIPTYNRADYIIETLKSVKNQTYQNWECIIVDDGSTDNTQEVVLNFVKSDSRFIWEQRPKQHKPGGCGARNYGFLISKGEYINWLDSDDLLKPDKIENQINLLLNYNADLAICDWQMFNQKKILETRSSIAANNPKTGLDVIKLMGKLKTFYIPNVYLVKRNVIIKSGLWNEYLRINQDGEFYCRVLMYSNSVVSDPMVQCLYRVHEGDRTSTNLNKDKSYQRVESWKLIESYLNLIPEENFNEFLDFQKTGVFFKALRIGDKDVINNNKTFFSKQLAKHPLYKEKILKIIQPMLKLPPIKKIYKIYKGI